MAATGFPICPSPTGHRERSRTARGFRRRNTRSSTKRRESGRSIRRTRATNGNRNSFTTTSCSWPIPACGRTRRTAFNIRDVKIVEDDGSQETILEIEVRGKRGVGYCKSTSGAVRPFQRLRDRNIARKAQQKQQAQPTDLIFPKTHRELFNTILDEENLKKDREGQARTAYSLRHTYICLRLMEGADIYQIAKNCRTSVEMIEKYYASHLKNSLDAAAINIRKKKPEESRRGTSQGSLRLYL